MYIEDVSPDSPAEKAGLIAKSDYIIGSPEAELNCLEDIWKLTKINIGQKVPLIIYRILDSEGNNWNKKREIIEIEIIPDDTWGGKGIIGCKIHTGVNFTIPVEENLSEENIEDSDEIMNTNEENKEVIEYMEVDHLEEAKDTILRGL